MKKLLTLLLVVFTTTIYSQTTINPDTVCVNSVGEQYFVTNTTGGSTYQWTVTGGGGTLQTGQGSNSITVDWGGTPGLYPNAISVTETNASGCPGIPVNLDVYILQLTLNNLGPFCVGDPSSTLTFSPAGGTLSGPGVIGNNFDPATAGVGNHVVTYSLAGCNTTVNVVVNNGPVTGPIQHY